MILQKHDWHKQERERISYVAARK